MSAPSTEHAKAHAEEAAKAPEAKAAPAGKPAEGKKGVDGSIGDLLSSIGEAAVRVAQVPGKVHHERAAAAHAAEAHAKEHEKDHPKGEKAEGGDDSHKKAEKNAEKVGILDQAIHIYEKWGKDDVEAKDITDLMDKVLDWADIEWARQLLIPVRWGLTKVLGAREKIEDYEMDYKNIGDRILKLNDKTLKPFLKRVKKDGLDDMENEIGDLLSVDRVKEEAKYNPDDLRAQITNLFNVKGNVTKAKLEERARRMKERLKNDKDVGDPKLTKTRNEFLENILKKALDSLSTPGVLEKLYPGAEDTKAKFEWTDDKYSNFGTTVLTTVDDKNKIAALNGLDIDSLNAAFTGLLPTIKPANLGTELGRKKVKEQAAALFRLSEPFDKDEIDQQVTALKNRLGNGLTSGSPEETKFTTIAGRITTAAAQFTPDVLGKLFPAEEDGKKKFEWTDEKYRNFGATVLTTVNDKNKAEALKGFDEDTFDATFNLLYPSLKTNLLHTATDRKRLKDQITALFKVTEPFQNSDLDHQKKAIFKRLGVPMPTATTTVALPHPLYQRLTKIVNELKDDTIARLLAGVSAVGPENFVDTFRDLDDPAEMAAYIRGYKSSSLKGNFFYLFEVDELKKVIASGSKEDRAEARNQLRLFADIKGPVRRSHIEAALRDFKENVSKAKTAYTGLGAEQACKDLEADLQFIDTNVTDDLLKGLLEAEKPKEFTVKYNEFGMQLKALKREEVPAYLKSFEEALFYGNFRFINKEKIDTFIDMKKAEIQSEVKNFLGIDGSVDAEDVVNFVEGAKKKCLSGLTASDGDKFKAFSECLEKVKRVLTEDRLNKIYS